MAALTSTVCVPQGKRLGSHVTYVAFSCDYSPIIPFSETMAAHRTSSLLEILPLALQTGYSKVVPELEPLKVPQVLNSHRQC
jgi:hypothetical protein